MSSARFDRLRWRSGERGSRGTSAQIAGVTWEPVGDLVAGAGLPSRRPRNEKSHTCAIGPPLYYFLQRYATLQNTEISSSL